VVEHQADGVRERRIGGERGDVFGHHVAGRTSRVSPTGRRASRTDRPAPAGTFVPGPLRLRAVRCWLRAGVLEAPMELGTHTPLRGGRAEG
jgi:hypothetical protein